VAGRSGKSFSLGGKSWTFIKSDQAHELAVVVPGEGERSSIFWTGGQAGFSSVVCRGVEQIIARGESVLPLPAGEQKLLSEVIHQFPALTPGALHIVEQPGKRGPEVTIFTFRGRKWNSILATIMKKESERKLSVSISDFSLTVKNPPKKDAAGTVNALLEKLSSESPRQLGAALTVPAPGRWKFGSAIPDTLIRDMSLTDYYQFPVFSAELRDAELVMIPSPDL